MKRLFLTLLTILCTLTSWAEDSYALLLHFATGKQVTFLLDSRPLVTFDGDDLVITTTRRTLRCPAGEVVKFSYPAFDKASIDAVSADETRLSLTDEGIVATNLEPLSDVAVYTANGLLLATAKADIQGHSTVGFTVQQGAVYVVRTSVATFKISKP